MKIDVVAAHDHSSSHRPELLQSEVCGCFHCLAVFPPAEIGDWIDESQKDTDQNFGKTALCPQCGIDSVIGSAAGYPITREFLLEMRQHWF